MIVPIQLSPNINNKPAYTIGGLFGWENKNIKFFQRKEGGIIVLYTFRILLKGIQGCGATPPRTFNT